MTIHTWERALVQLTDDGAVALREFCDANESFECPRVSDLGCYEFKISDLMLIFGSVFRDGHEPFVCGDISI